MHLPTSFTPPPLTREPPALVRVVVSHADVTWDRPVFKAPPLDVRPPLDDVAALAAERRRDFRFAA